MGCLQEFIQGFPGFQGFGCEPFDIRVWGPTLCLQTPIMVEHCVRSGLLLGWIYIALQRRFRARTAIWDPHKSQAPTPVWVCGYYRIAINSTLNQHMCITYLFSTVTCIRIHMSFFIQTMTEYVVIALPHFQLCQPCPLLWL